MVKKDRSAIVNKTNKNENVTLILSKALKKSIEFSRISVPQNFGEHLTVN